MADPLPPEHNRAFAFPPMAELLRREGVRLSKHKSQHFLRNPAVCERIADLALLTPSHAALEVGAGLGNLTVSLARRAGRVLSVELDQTFRNWHETLSTAFPNLDFLYLDFLKTDLAEIAERFGPSPRVAVGNLPYQITAPILFHFVESDVPFERLVFMVQREVAERMVVGVPDRRASALTYKLAFLYDMQIAMTLGPQEFIPPPQVHSAVVVLTPKATPAFRDTPHRERVFRVVHQVFQHRRRSLANAMHLGGLTPDRAAAEAALAQAGVEPLRRAETLSLEEVLALEAALASA